MALEASLERRCCTLARKRGIWAVKLMPSVAGLPDRLLLIPGGRVAFIEFKSPTGRVRPVQERVHGMLRSLGFTVEVIRHPAEFCFVLDRYWVPEKK